MLMMLSYFIFTNVNVAFNANLQYFVACQNHMRLQVWGNSLLTGTVALWWAAADVMDTRLSKAFASPASPSPFPIIPPAPASVPCEFSWSSGRPASRFRISTDSVSLFRLRNCSTAIKVCWSSDFGAPPAGGDEESTPLPAFPDRFAEPSLRISGFVSFSVSSSIDPSCTAAILPGVGSSDVTTREVRRDV